MAEYLVFKSDKSGNRVVVPAEMALVIDRDGSTVIYTIAGNGKDRMVWELSKRDRIKVASSAKEALDLSVD